MLRLFESDDWYEKLEEETKPTQQRRLYTQIATKEVSQISLYFLPQSQNTEEISHSTNYDIEISFFQVGIAKMSTFSPNQFVMCQSKLEQYFISNNNKFQLACVRNDRLDQALQFIEHLKSQNLQINTGLYITIINGFCKLNQADDAMKYFSLMRLNSCISQLHYIQFIT